MRHTFGTTSDGRAIDRLILQNGKGIAIHLLTFGGAIHQLVMPDRQGHRGNVVLSLPDTAAYEANPFFGTIIGRYANRLSGGGCRIDGQFMPLDADANGITLHGGAANFSNAVWQAEICADGKGVVFCHISPDGDSGFPGTLEVTVTYTLSEDSLDIAMHASCDQATPLNLSIHPYFNLSGGIQPTVHAHLLRVHAESFTPILANQLPTGAITGVTNTALDFTTLAPIGPPLASGDPQIAMGRGINHNFVLADTMRAHPAPAVELIDPESGRAITMHTDRPGVQIYTGNWFDGSLHDLEQRPIPRHGGVAIEPQHFPDSLNHPVFPDTILRPGDVFTSLTRFVFGSVG